MQGVHPAAKAIPSVNEPSIPRGFSSEKTSVFVEGGNFSKRLAKAKAMMMIPPMILTQGVAGIAEATSPRGSQRHEDHRKPHMKPMN